MNGLPCKSPNCNSFIPGWLFGAEFDTISTVRNVTAPMLAAMPGIQPETEGLPKANAERAAR
jgi:hypothetical protein